ncbi:MAG: sodium-dependent transporter [Chromatiaceae bacterium]
MTTANAAVQPQWSSRLMFIIAATGAAVGLGNIWKFPYIMGQNGGGAFMLMYLLCILLIGIPVLMAEVMIGRRGRQSPGLSVKALAIEAKVNPLWQIAGWMGLVGGFLILSFYSVIAGWAFAYVSKAAQNSFAGQSASDIGAMFGQFSADLSSLLLWTTLVIVLTCVVVARGVKQGLEQVIRWMMPALYLLLIGLAIYAGLTGDFAKAVHFMFAPDFSKLSVSGMLIALGHAFFTLSLASGVMITYGAYMPGRVSIARTSIWIALADTSVALIAAMVIYPIVFAHNLDAGQGPGLIFVTLPVAFGQMPGGQLVGTLFFVMLVFAAFTSTIAMIESVVAWLTQAKGFSRVRACVLSGIVLWCLSLLTVFSFSGASWTQWQFHFVGKEVNNLFEIIDHLTSDIMLPLGGLAIAIFAGWKVQRHASREELNTSPVAYSIWLFCIRWFTPVAIVAVFLNLTGVL